MVELGGRLFHIQAVPESSLKLFIFQLVVNEKLVRTFDVFFPQHKIIALTLLT